MASGPPPASILHDARRIPIGPGGIQIGRRSDNDLVLSTDRASRHHARIAAEDGGYRVADLDSSNGTLVNGERIRGESRSLSDGDTIAIGGEVLRFITSEAGTRIGDVESAVAVPAERVTFSGERLTIGRDESNDLVLGDPNVSRFHAEIRQVDGGIELRDLASTNGTRLDGRPVTSARVDTGSEIGIGPFRLIFDGDSFLTRNDRGALRMDVEGVSVTVGDKQILEPTSFSIEPGQLVAIIGESGAGKTTLIKALAGVSRPTGGAITVSGEPVALRLTDLGYVPQDEIVHRRLTVREALDYSARLRLPEDAGEDDVTDAVHRVLGEVSLEEHCDTLVDSLSGGQRKRAGVGVELLGRPSLLFLDEPTTGLDPSLESRMMKLLRELANQDRAVAVITHATKNLALCDRLAVMARGGVLAFFGAPREALEFFGVDSFDDIYEVLDSRPPHEWQERFESTRRRVSAEETDALSEAPAEGPEVTERRRHVLPQAWVLARRYARLLTRDRRNLVILFGQVPVLGLLAAGLFKADVFETGPGHAGDTATLLFLLLVTASWLGSIAAAREIVKERSVYDREAATGVRLSAYLGSKAAILLAVGAIQAVVLFAIVTALRPLKEPTSVYAEVLVIMVLTSCAAVGFGLLISAWVRSEDQATSIIPVAMIPQFFFGGALVTLERMAEPVASISKVVFVQWSYAGVGTSMDMNARIEADTQFTSTYGTSFFDLGAGTASAILVGFLAAAMAGTAFLLRRRGA